MCKVIIRINQIGDPKTEARIAADLRVDLWAKSKVEIDSDDPQFNSKCDLNSNQRYFEFETDFPEEVARVIETFGYSNKVQLILPASTAA